MKAANRILRSSVKVFHVFLFCPLLVIHFLLPSLLEASKPQTEPNQELVPAGLLKWPEKGSDYAVLVDKSLQKVFVYHRDNLFEPAKIFTCSTGENDGPKLRQGDRKTPEGIYFFTHTIEKKDLAPIYGSRAIPVDYPNLVDRKEGKDGYGIWFHGTNKELKPRDTNGCIALENGNIDELASFITLNDTPVLISARIEMVDPQEAKKEAHELMSVIERWRSAWEGKEIDTYVSYYSPKFSASGKDWQQWKEYKRSLTRKYSSIDVGVENLRILKNSGLVVATFRQKYSTESFRSAGEKTLFLQQNSDQWRIVGETFRSPAITRLAAVGKEAKPPVPDQEILSFTEEINAFLGSWQKAWEHKRVDQYLSFYDPGFTSQGMNLKQWKLHKQKLNAKYRTIEVDVSEVNIQQTSEATATVTFKQDYRTEDYQDVGLKKLFLVNRNKQWKIQGEEWRPLNREVQP